MSSSPTTWSEPQWRLQRFGLRRTRRGRRGRHARKLRRTTVAGVTPEAWAPRTSRPARSCTSSDTSWGSSTAATTSINCKPNYRSVMSYNRQFAGSPIPNRRLDYSRSLDPDPAHRHRRKTGLSTRSALNEPDALGSDPSLGPIPPFFPSADQIVFGPNAWSLVSANAADINWNRLGKIGFQTNASAKHQPGATTGCDGAGTLLEGHDDWSNLLYRSSAAVDFVGGPNDARRDDQRPRERAFYQGRDADGNGVGDGMDCGGTVPPMAPPPSRARTASTFRRASSIRATSRIVIFSEVNGTQVWNAPAQVRTEHPHVRVGIRGDSREDQQQGRRDVRGNRLGGPHRPARKTESRTCTVSFT